MTEQDAPTLSDVLQRFDFDLPADQVERLERYCHSLWQWNSKLNLTRHTDFEKFVSRDLIDSLELSKLLSPGTQVLDVGSGGGVPGVLLAILRPDVGVSLCESVGKKAAALRAIVDEVGLMTPVHACRAESLLQNQRFDVLVARAVGPLWKMLFWFENCWDSIGYILAVKGPRWPEERGEARHRGQLMKLQLRRAAAYPMPGTDSESVILKIWEKEKPEP